MKISFDSLKPRVLNYRGYKPFENKSFWEELLYEVSYATYETTVSHF